MFRIDQLSKTPIYEQIIEQLEKFVLLDVIKPGEPLPSVRSLSVELCINPNTIQKAYSELDQRGVIRSVPGKGCFIASDAKAILRENGKNRLAELYGLCCELKLCGVSFDSAYETLKNAYGGGEDI